MSARIPRLSTLLCIIALTAGCQSLTPPPDPADPPTPPDQGNEFGTFTPGLVALKQVDMPEGSFFKLYEADLVFKDADAKAWIAPVGALTDGASIPRAVLMATNGRFDKNFLKAAIVHDAYCQKENSQLCPQYQSETWQKVHLMFHNACRAGGTSHTLAGTMYSFVWLFGPRWSDPANDLDDVPEEMLMIGADSCAAFIEQKQPEVEEITAWLVEREPALREVGRAELELNDALAKNDPAAIDDAISRADTALDQAQTALPNDVMLLNLEGYHLSNRAAAFSEKGKTAEADRDLQRAEQAFQAVTGIDSLDPNAAKGLERVKIIRGDDLVQSEKDVRRDLDRDPEDPATKRNMQLIQRRRTIPPPS